MPNPFVRPEVQGQVEGLDLQFAADGTSGSIVVEVHYERGVFRKALVTATRVVPAVAVDPAERTSA